MAKVKKITEKNEGEPVIDLIVTGVPEEIEVTNLTEAEKLQKNGWRLISISQTSNCKIYKFER